MVKKKIMFMLINMNVGGTEKALLTMLSEIPKDKYEITLLLLEEYGGFLAHIPDGVRVIYFRNYQTIKSVLNDPPILVCLQLLKRGNFKEATNIMLYHSISQISNNRKKFFQYVLKDFAQMDDDYDVAVAYAGPMDFISYFVEEKVKAKRKIQWIHFDISKIGFNSKFASKIYNKYDQIFVVSEEGRKKLISKLPELECKTDKFSNIISQKWVIQLANEGKGFDDDFQGIRILTVGRLSKEKGQDLTIPVLAKLKSNGYPVRWYCIGEGNARTEYERLIQEYGVENDYILLGANPNPYPFMKQCDIYVQSSRHEGYCITLAEARCFSNPIISTDFTGAMEQILHEQTGLIVSFDAEQMYEGIRRLCDDKKLSEKLSSNLMKESVDTTKEMEKLYQFIDS